MKPFNVRGAAVATDHSFSVKSVMTAKSHRS
jgi:MFS family permease